MAEQFNPTRMELIKARQRAKLAAKGHQLLKQKRDALVMEFFKIMSKAKDLRGELEEQMARSYASLGVAQAFHGIFEVEHVALATPNISGVNLEVKNVMGVKIPSLEEVQVKKGVLERGYSFVGSSAKIDEATEAFENSLHLVLKLAETENAMKKLITEIEKTKRRVNALEYVVIPRLKSQAKAISFRLDEMERDNFFTLKMMKGKLKAK
ncbi:MAG: V-type ATP synthase subunit D [Candidatus Diapherotrites archaeon]